MRERLGHAPHRACITVSTHAKTFSDTCASTVRSPAIPTNDLARRASCMVDETRACVQSNCMHAHGLHAAMQWNDRRMDTGCLNTAKRWMTFVSCPPLTFQVLDSQHSCGIQFVPWPMRLSIARVCVRSSHHLHTEPCPARDTEAF